MVSHKEAIQSFDKLDGEQTNEEYIKSCTTEQLAEWLVENIDCVRCCCKKDLCCQDYNSCKLTFVEWLKRPHNTGGTK